MSPTGILTVFASIWGTVGQGDFTSTLADVKYSILELECFFLSRILRFQSQLPRGMTSLGAVLVVGGAVCGTVSFSITQVQQYSAQAELSAGTGDKQLLSGQGYSFGIWLKHASCKSKAS